MICETLCKICIACGVPKGCAKCITNGKKRVACACEVELVCSRGFTIKKQYQGKTGGENLGTASWSNAGRNTTLTLDKHRKASVMPSYTIYSSH